MHMCPNCGIALRRFEPIQRGNIELCAGGDLLMNGQPVELTAQMRIIVEALVRADGRILSRDVLLGMIDSDGDERSVDIAITRARKRFRKIDPTFDQVKPIRGMGYRWITRQMSAPVLSLVA